MGCTQGDRTQTQEPPTGDGPKRRRRPTRGPSLRGGIRLGTKEIKSAALVVPEVAEAAVVPVTDKIKGKLPDLYVALKPGIKTTKALADKVSAAVVTEIGAIAKPHAVLIVPDMPKTRSGKIMRRVLATLSNHQDPGDVSTLANPEVVDKIREAVK